MELPRGSGLAALAQAGQASLRYAVVACANKFLPCAVVCGRSDRG